MGIATIFLHVKISANQKSSFVATCMFSCLGMDNKFNSVYIISMGNQMVTSEIRK